MTFRPSVYLTFDPESAGVDNADVVTFPTLQIAIRIRVAHRQCPSVQLPGMAKDSQTPTLTSARTSQSQADSR